MKINWKILCKIKLLKITKFKNHAKFFLWNMIVRCLFNIIKYIKIKQIFFINFRSNNLLNIKLIKIRRKN